MTAREWQRVTREFHSAFAEGSLFQGSWENGVYVVSVESIALTPDHRAAGLVVGHAEIMAYNMESPRRWSDLQDIKNAFFGADSVGIEIFPAQASVGGEEWPAWHLWAYPPGVAELPFDVILFADRRLRTLAPIRR